MEYLAMASVVNVLRKEYRKWVSSLSAKERHAIRKYSYNSYDKKPNRFFERLNRMLRGRYNQDDKYVLEDYSKVISAAMNRHPLQSNIICFRGGNENMVEGLRPGTIFAIKQYLSTSVIKSRALDGKYKYIIYVQNGALGAYIEEISYFPKQREFLLDKNQYYKFISQEENIIKLEVVI